ncbi:MAG: ribonuclease P protein component [Candidatus Zambryskibacteria bacterium CG11_big_fil_rev_8_21_14_0_20_42_18]|uniref:Ribonuclease P protein component n=1 Tax=Candidatus Zambryskibacteria bacterium CG_4_9_14_3_um_filter_42_15 TaxID=1975112 RepID=A0A2M7WSW9_9BACT|nr:MAG: ribonuclease P protein component [Candidatus Zambryskibacteria bacterium CG11_big_fil_rev_8_21_14_0_20_42_18]PJA32976.1 MAG: ribonuclease P protein component [Candidatus Zambryskibacteria bacterium CG_4_9_14_3_um_filter_42_15]
MLPKTQRIPRKLFGLLLESKKYLNSEHFSLRITSSEKARIAVSVSKKISKKAVVRNKIRRRAYSVLKEFIPLLPPNLFLLIAKSGADRMKSQDLKKELSLLFKKV